MEIGISVLLESWHLLLEASVYILFGMVVGGDDEGPAATAQVMAAVDCEVVISPKSV